MIKKILYIVQILIISCCCIYASGDIVVNSLLNKSKLLDKNSETIDTTLKKLETIYKFAERHFLYDIDYDKVYEAMASAMIDALGDEWSMYINSELSKYYEDNVLGSYSGIGIYLTKSPLSKQDPKDIETLYVIITGCFPNGPAFKSGLKPHDLITHIDDESVIGKTATECSSLMKGEANTIVKLTVLRDGEVQNINVKREQIFTPTTSETLIDDILYLRINSFTIDTANQVKKVINDEKGKYSYMILDLRNNSGGNVRSCLDVASLFLSPNKVTMISKGKKDKQVYKSSGNTELNPLLPMVVLINEGSASASEILTGALKDNGRATVIGKKSFGKGVMQVSAPFYQGYVNVTTNEFFTPNEDKVNKVGITPDIEVDEQELTDEEKEEILKIYNSGDIPITMEKYDSQLREAIKYLKSI